MAKVDKEKIRQYWKSVLTQRYLSLFTWSIEGEGTPSLPLHEIERYLYLYGVCALVRVHDSDRLLIVRGSEFGVTDYPDLFEQFIWATPNHEGVNTIGDDCAVCRNDFFKNEGITIVNYYTELLTEATVSLKMSLVNSRASGIAVASTQKVADAINTWWSRLFNGSYYTVVDNSDLSQIAGTDGVKFVSTMKSSTGELKDVLDVNSELLTMFYDSVGIRSVAEKKERLISKEVVGSDGRLLLNVSDMMEWRRKFCDEVNRIFGIPLTVRLTISQEEGGDQSAENDSDAERDVQNDSE